MLLEGIRELKGQNDNLGAGVRTQESKVRRLSRQVQKLNVESRQVAMLELQNRKLEDGVEQLRKAQSQLMTVMARFGHRPLHGATQSELEAKPGQDQATQTDSTEIDGDKEGSQKHRK